MNKVFYIALASVVFFSCKPKTTAPVVDSIGYFSVKDKAGNTYKAIQIGSQKWMVENLKTVRYSDILLDNNKKPISDSIRTLLPSDS